MQIRFTHIIQKLSHVSTWSRHGQLNLHTQHNTTLPGIPSGVRLALQTLTLGKASLCFPPQLSSWATLALSLGRTTMWRSTISWSPALTMGPWLHTWPPDVVVSNTKKTNKLQHRQYECWLQYHTQVRCLQCWCLFTSQSMITFTPQSKQKKNNWFHKCFQDKGLVPSESHGASCEISTQICWWQSKRQLKGLWLLDVSDG